MHIKKLTLTSFILLLCFQVCLSAYAQNKEVKQDKLIFASEIIRHGDRTPTATLPTAPYAWPEGLGELTAIGMQQEFKLGQEFRKFYITQEKLLPNNYDPKTLYVRSSNFNRTLMSAQSVLLGLYPLGTGPRLANNKYALSSGFQPIPIHTIEVSKDDLLVAHDTKRIEFNNLVKQIVYQTPKWQKQNKQLAEKFKQWSKALEIPINNLDDVFSLGDNLYIRQLHQAPIPKGLSQQDLDEIIHWSAVVQAEEYMPRQIGVLTGKDLLVNLRDKMQEKINLQTNNKTNNKPADFILYSGHDISLLAFLSAIGAPAKINPPYASHISVRLFQTSNIEAANKNKDKDKDKNKNLSKNTYYFTVLLNNKAVTIPGCSNSNQCNLLQLNTIIKQLD